MMSAPSPGLSAFRAGILLACALGPGMLPASDTEAIVSMQAALGARQICIGTVSGAPATRVSVPLTLNDGEGVAGLQVDVRYDPQRVQAVRARLGADTAVAGGWSVDSQVLEDGRLRVVGFSNPPAGLGPGFKQVALVEFDVPPDREAREVPLPLEKCILGDVNGVAIPCSVCPQPGATVAAARFARVSVDDAFGFRPARVVVERGDWVLWTNVGSTLSHTTTSGPVCTANGLWDGPLPPGTLFARPFGEPPGKSAYFCTPHCLQAETGEVEVTSAIDLRLETIPGASLLTWTGGAGLYRVARSDSPFFPRAGTTFLDPAGGPAGTSLIDVATPGLESALFYLVLNSF